MQSGERERAGSSEQRRIKNNKQASTDSDTELHGGVQGAGLQRSS